MKSLQTSVTEKYIASFTSAPLLFGNQIIREICRKQVREAHQQWQDRLPQLISQMKRAKITDDFYKIYPREMVETARKIVEIENL
jgi:hypothetical protein